MVVFFCLVKERGVKISLFLIICEFILFVYYSKS